MPVLEAGAATERAAVAKALENRRPDPNGHLVSLARERLARGVSAEVNQELRTLFGI